MPAPLHDDLPELIELAEQRRAMRKLRRELCPDPKDEDGRTLLRIENAIGIRLWRLAYEIAGSCRND